MASSHCLNGGRYYRNVSRMLSIVHLRWQRSSGFADAALVSRCRLGMKLYPTVRGITAQYPGLPRRVVVVRSSVLGHFSSSPSRYAQCLRVLSLQQLCPPR